MSRRGWSDATDPRRRAWLALLRSSAAVLGRLDEEMRAGADLSLPEYDALLHTADAGEHGLRMSALAEHVVLTRAGLTALVDRLERRGLLRRSPDPDDRRATRVLLTDEGWDRFRGAAALHLAGIERYFSDLVDEDEARLLADVLGRVQRVLDDTEQPPAR